MGCMVDYESRDCTTSLWGEHSIYAKSLTIHADWHKSSARIGCCNIQMITKEEYISEWQQLQGPEPRSVMEDLQ